MPALKLNVLDLVRSKGLEKRAEAFQLSPGEWSFDYIDGKKAVAEGTDLRLVAEAVLEQADELGVQFDAVGGLTMGADPLSHAVALLSGKSWFSVRKERKEHGKKNLTEGAQLKANDRVLLVDDVVTTGKSILQALDAIREFDAEVVLAVCMVDRGKRATDDLSERGVTYAPLLTYADLGIDAVGAR